MAVIKLGEDYSVAQLRKDVRDSLMMAGEQSILLQLFHPGDPDAVPCPECGDDVYQAPEEKCTSCYGTMFLGGVRNAMIVWSLFTDHKATETLGKRGTYEPDHRSVQFEAFPTVAEHDIVVRVRRWLDGKPAEIYGFYMLQGVDQRSLRTGNRFGQYSGDLVAQKAEIAAMPFKPIGITSFPIIGQTFEESVQIHTPSDSAPAFAVMQPDVKVIYFPFDAGGPGGPTPETPEESQGSYTFVQTIAQATWVIHHPLGYNPDVSIIVGNEEVEAEVSYPNTAVVIITFGVPVSGTARLT